MKLTREAMAHYLDPSFKNDLSAAGTADWEVLGDDIEEMSMEMNPDTEPKKNILGETKTVDKGYEPSMDADPYYADPTKKIYPKVRSIALDRLKGDQCNTLMLEVIIEDTEATKHLAYVQQVMVKVKSYGGDTEGVNFPFTISENGSRVKGYVTAESVKAGKPVFAEGEIAG